MGRVSDECENNKRIEIPEFFYFFNLAKKKKKIYSDYKLKPLINHAINLMDKYQINSRKGLAECNYYGPVNSVILIHFYLKGTNKKISNLFKRIFLKNL